MALGLGAALGGGLCAVAAFAQGDGGGGAGVARETSGVASVVSGGASGGGSFFSAFFWSSDLLGLAIIWVLIVCSFVSLGLTLVFVMRYRRESLIPEQTQGRLEELLAAKQYREAIALANRDPSYLGRITSAALNEAGNGYGAMERALEEAGDAEATRILRPIEVLNVMGNIAPMVGLFGTVYGMIVAFQRLVDAGGSPDPVDLAAGISTALVTTFWGLVVAIPALAAYAVVRNKIDAVTAEGLVTAERIIKPFSPRKKRAASGGGTDGQE
ncbi:MAG: MotA/TolQ/ExbB proton channel family protein [Planctomycetota bacterium]